MRLSGKVALVTGAASGLGQASAAALGERGAKVALLDVREAPSGNGRLSIACDVSDEAQVAQAIARIERDFGGLDVAVNCAGISSATKLVAKGEPHPLALWKKVIEVNLTGTFNVMRLAAARMACNAPDPESGDRGVIVNTASGAAYDGQRGQAAYAASKAGIVGLTLPVARDLAELSIRCVAIAPGLFETGMIGDIPPKAMEALNRQLLYPKRMGRPEEFAALVVHIVENGYLNGEVVRLDGAIRLAANV